MTVDELLPSPPVPLWMTTGPHEVPSACEGDLMTSAARLVRSLYCATKPMVALAFLSLLEERDIELDRARIDPEGHIGDDGPWAVADLLWHRAGLTAPTIWQALRLPLGSLDPTLDTLLARAAARRATRQGYSDVTAWYLLGKAAARLVGDRWALYLQDCARPAVGERLWFAPDRELLELPVEAIATLSARHNGVDVPLVYAMTRRSRALVSPHLGAYGSFNAVFTWFEHLGAHLAADHRRTALFPSRAYLRRALDSCGRPGQRCAASFQLERVLHGGYGCDLIGVQAAGGAISVWLDVEGGRVLGILGGTFYEVAQERREWVRSELEAAWAWREAWHGPR